MIGFVRAFVIGLVVLAPAFAQAGVVPVNNAATLVRAIANAKPGDVITLAPGTYTVSATIRINRAGTAAARIVVRAASLGSAKLRLSAIEGIKVSAPYWTFENLDIEGTCSSHSRCEHAFHIVGRAHFTTVRRCRLHEYNAHIKGNGEIVGGSRVWPNDVLIEQTEMFSKSARNTSNPVTPVDVVGGRRWTLRANYIHDYAKGAGNGVSYAAFLKGNSRDGVFERNLVICEKLHRGRTRLGLSFGGGGTSPASVCEGGVCTPEHQNGVMRNNIIVNCPSDVGIYLNKARNAKIYNNTIFNSRGIDVRFGATVADLKNNVLSGVIRNRDGGKHTKSGNRMNATPANFRSWFTNPAGSNFAITSAGRAVLVDKGVAVASVTDDFCRNDRNDGKHDIGALEYDGDRSCSTVRPYGGPAGGGNRDAGGPVTDGGGAADATAGATDAGSAIEGGGPTGDGAIAPSDDSGCACHTGGGGPSSSLLVGVALLLLIRRRGTASD